MEKNKATVTTEESEENNQCQMFLPLWKILVIDLLSHFSINLLVVYRESVNLIGYITRRLSATSGLLPILRSDWLSY